jgi:hypothetical protein
MTGQRISHAVIESVVIFVEWEYSISTLNSDKISKIWDEMRMSFKDNEKELT